MPRSQGDYYKKPSPCESCGHEFVNPAALRRHQRQDLCDEFCKLTPEELNKILGSKAMNVNKTELDAKDMFTYIQEGKTRWAECFKCDVRVDSSRGPTNGVRHYKSLHVPIIGFLMCRGCEATFVKTLSNAKAHLETCPMRKNRDRDVREWDNVEKRYCQVSTGATEPKPRTRSYFNQAALIFAAGVAHAGESATSSQEKRRPTTERTSVSNSRRAGDTAGESKAQSQEEDEETDSSTDSKSTYLQAHPVITSPRSRTKRARRRNIPGASVFEAQAREGASRANIGEGLESRPVQSVGCRERVSRTTSAGRITKPKKNQVRPVITRQPPTPEHDHSSLFARASTPVITPAPFDDQLPSPLEVQRPASHIFDRESGSLSEEEQSQYSHFDDAWHW
ncbi:hypothetical protein JCM5350_004673 [Sporobolomyces pararoseus]